MRLMKKTILASIIDPTKEDNSFYEDECRSLCEQAGYDIVVSTVQKLRKPIPGFAFGKGKIETIKTLIDETEAEAVVINNYLRYDVLKNLSEEFGVEVIDRFQLILNIFRLHASSKEAKLQIEIASLRYMSGYRDETHGSDDQQGGTLHNRGSGESYSSLYRKRNKKRIEILENELSELKKRKEITYRKRRDSLLKRVVLVGYTNAGKSSLMNAMVDREDKKVLAEDRLFATLDTGTRYINYRHYGFILSDSVGFVSDLPHALIQSFRSTLDVINEADLLIHVIDSSNKDYRAQKEVTENTLKEIHADHIPRLDLYHKCDLAVDTEHDHISSVYIQSTIDDLLNNIIETLYPAEQVCKVKVPVSHLYQLQPFYEICSLNEIETVDDYTIYEVAGEKATVDRLMKLFE